MYIQLVKKMGVAMDSYSCVALCATLLHVQIVAGSSTQEQSSLPSNVTVESDFGQALSPHRKTFATGYKNPCDITPSSPDCYQLPCKDNDPQCGNILLLNAQADIPVINEKDFKRVGFRSVMESVLSGISLALKECKHRFYSNLWNCPVSQDMVLTGNIHSSGTQQMSYVQAISAAGVMHSVTKRCARGNGMCRCGKISKKDKRKYAGKRNMYKWGGCANNVNFGESVSEQFFETNIQAKDSSKMTTLSKLHNERVGRMAVKNSVKLKCRCHGICGSCTIKSCWTALANFRVVGDLLHKKYERSKRVTDLEELVNLNRINLDDVNNSTNSTIPNDKVLRKHDLVYFADPPDYCVVNYTAGSPGSNGRECEKTTSKGIALLGSCENLCKRCGNKVEKIESVENYDCCEMVWCCSIRCPQCKKKVTKYFCK